MFKQSSVIDLFALEQISEDHKQQQAARRSEQQQAYCRARQREDAAWTFLDAVTRLTQEAGECQSSNVQFDATPFVVNFVEAFFRVCDVMREQQLGAALADLDEDLMIARYGQDKWPQLARIGYQTALAALSEAIASGKKASLQKRLAKTLQTGAGRHLWYFAYAIVRALLVGDYQLFRKTVQLRDSATNAKRRRPCYERDQLWLEWHNAGLRPAAIRDRWNRAYEQHGGAKIAQGRSGRYVVKEALRKARLELPKENG